MKNCILIIAILLLQGCVSLNPECLFQGEIYDITPETRLFYLENGTKIKIENRLVLFAIGAGGWISAPDDIHSTRSGELFKTKEGKLVGLGQCPL